MLIVSFVIINGINVIALKSSNTLDSVSMEEKNDLSCGTENKNFNTLTNNQNEIFPRIYIVDRFLGFFKKYSLMDPVLIKNYVDNSSELYINSTSDLPDYFSWTDYNGKDWTTPTRGQGNCGGCWAFSALGTLESIINIREGNADLDPDLSEQYILSCLPRAGNCRGGTPEAAFFYIEDDSDDGNNCNGVVSESCFPYQADDNIPCSEKPDNWREFLVPICAWQQVDLGYDTYRVREVLKTWIMENGPVTTGVYVNSLFRLWGKLFHNIKFYFPYIKIIDNIYNHCLTIVGWNDNPMIKRGGYWICKNSWGISWGDNGFISIEYGSLNIAAEIVWVDYDPDSFDWPPSIPTIEGLTKGTAGVEYNFTFTAIDSDGNNDIYYYIDWGDGANSGWLGPFDAGISCIDSHIWNRNGEYRIKVRAKDANGLVSEWSQSFVVGITKNRMKDTEFTRLLYRCPQVFPLAQLIFNLSFNNYGEIL